MQPIVIASVHRKQYSETFIHNHIKHLPYQVHYLYGSYLPAYFGNHQPFLPYYHPSLYNLVYKQLQSRIVKYLVENKIKLVLAEYGPVAVNMLPACEKANVPLMVYFHGYDIYRSDILKKYLNVYQQVFEYAHTLFVVSKEMKLRLIELGAPARKVVVNPCGADLSLFTYHNAGNNPPTLFAAGRFEEKKNPLASIMAFSIAAKSVPQAKLKMAGNGSLLKKAKRLANLLKIEDKIDFLGALSHKQVSIEMLAARAFVQHSTTAKNGDKEGAPVSIMEAGASGLPIIATKHGGITDIVLHDETGYLTDEGDVVNMANHMVDLLSDPHKASSMGLAGQQRIAQHFSLEKNIRLLCKYIEQVL